MPPNDIVSLLGLYSIYVACCARLRRRPQLLTIRQAPVFRAQNRASAGEPKREWMRDGLRRLSFFGLGLEDSHVPTFLCLLQFSDLESSGVGDQGCGLSAGSLRGVLGVSMEGIFAFIWSLPKSGS